MLQSRTRTQHRRQHRSRRKHHGNNPLLRHTAAAAPVYSHGIPQQRQAQPKPPRPHRCRNIRQQHRRHRRNAEPRTHKPARMACVEPVSRFQQTRCPLSIQQPVRHVQQPHGHKQGTRLPNMLSGTRAKAERQHPQRCNCRCVQAQQMPIAQRLQPPALPRSKALPTHAGCVRCSTDYSRRHTLILSTAPRHRSQTQRCHSLTSAKRQKPSHPAPRTPGSPLETDRQSVQW